MFMRGKHLVIQIITRISVRMVYVASSKKNPVRGGVLTGSVGGGNEGKEVTSFRLAM
jgi:hypothetical protein